MELPPEWSAATTPFGKEFTFHAGMAKAARPAFVIGVVIIALCLYWDWLFIENWVFDKAEILPAGVVLFLVILGGAAFGVYCIRRVFSSTKYLLGSDSFTVTKKAFSKESVEKFQKAQITGINLLYTPPKEAPLEGTWAVVLDIRDLQGGKARSLALEGYGEKETKIISDALSTWTGIRVIGANTAE
jgi:hypothetical protein